MARKRSHASRAVLPREADDFKLIKSIGPAIERRLHVAGIHTFARLATLSPDEVAALIPGLSAQRVAKQGWLRQARRLAPKQARARPHKEAATTGRQHYANFTVELLLDENDEARRTRVVHIQSGDADTWAGWEAARLVDFLDRHTAARSPAVKPVSLVAATPKTPPPLTVATGLVPEAAATSELVQPGTTAGPAPPVVTSVEPVLPFAVAAESTPQIVATSEPIQPIATAKPVPQIVATPEPIQPVATERGPLSPVAADLTGALRLRDLEIVPTGSDDPDYVLHHDQPFIVRLTLDLTKVVAPSDVIFVYKVAIIAKQLGGLRQLVGEARNTIELSESATLSFAGINLPPGVYRLEAHVTLAPAGTEPGRQPGLTAFLKGDLLQIY